MINQNLTIQAYNRYTRAYDKSVVGFWSSFPRSFLANFASNLPGKRILSVGSGSGRDALLLRELGLDVACVDAAPNMVAITKELGFASHQATFEEMRFAPASFDGAWAHGSLLHVPMERMPSILQRLRTYLRPRGALAIGVLKGKGERMYRHSIMPGHTRYMQLYQSEELQRVVTAQGFAFMLQEDYVLPYDTFLNHLYVRSER